MLLCDETCRGVELGTDRYLCNRQPQLIELPGGQLVWLGWVGAEWIRGMRFGWYQHPWDDDESGCLERHARCQQSDGAVGVVYGDGNLSAGNIKSGVSIFGVTGNFNPVSTYNHWTHSGQWNGYYMRATDMANLRKFCRENGRDGMISYSQTGCCGVTVWWYNDSNPQNNNYGKSSGADQDSWPHVTSITCGNTSNLY